MTDTYGCISAFSELAMGMNTMITSNTVANGSWEEEA
jgi:hypothetical protein